MTIPVLYASPKPLFEGGKFLQESNNEGSASTTTTLQSPSASALANAHPHQQ